MMQVFYLDATYVYDDFKCFFMFLQVFLMHVSNVLFVFRRMLQLLYLNVSQLNRIYPRHSTVSPRCQTQESEGGPTGAGKPHVLASLTCLQAAWVSGHQPHHLASASGFTVVMKRSQCSVAIVK
jgi:hypothetical protein